MTRAMWFGDRPPTRPVTPADRVRVGLMTRQRWLAERHQDRGSVILLDGRPVDPVTTVVECDDVEGWIELIVRDDYGQRRERHYGDVRIVVGRTVAPAAPADPVKVCSHCETQRATLRLRLQDGDLGLWCAACYAQLGAPWRASVMAVPLP